MDKSTIDSLGNVNDSLIEHLKWLLEKKDLDALSRLISIVDKLTTALIKIHEATESAA
jgi:hypothetical protein